MARAVRTLLTPEVPAVPWSIHVLLVHAVDVEYVAAAVPAPVASISGLARVLFAGYAALVGHVMDLVVDHLGHGALVDLWVLGAHVVHVDPTVVVGLVFLGVAVLVD